jgi:hypothetical protein
VPDEASAVALALADLAPGDMVVVFYDDLPAVADVLRRSAAVAVAGCTEAAAAAA